MSFEGYYQVKCTAPIPHYRQIDCYSYDSGEPCRECGKPTVSKLVDQTNGESEGYDEHFADDCDAQITIWKSQLAEMKSDIALLMLAYKKYRYTREYSEEDKLIDELRVKYNLEGV